MEPMDRARIEAELRGLLREYVRHPDRPIHPGDHLVFDLEIEDDDASFDMIPEIHRRFGIDPPASAWSSAATVADVVALIERYQRQPPTPEERARDQAEQRERAWAMRRFASRFAAVAGAAVGIELAGGAGAALLGAALGLCFIATLPRRARESRRLHRERQAWKARRMAEQG